MNTTTEDGHCPICGCWLEEMAHAKECPNKTWIATLGTDYKQLIIDEDAMDKILTPAKSKDEAEDNIYDTWGSPNLYPNSAKILRLHEYDAPEGLVK